jgi:hypothetical protein
MREPGIKIRTKFVIFCGLTSVHIGAFEGNGHECCIHILIFKYALCWAKKSDSSFMYRSVPIFTGTLQFPVDF